MADTRKYLATTLEPLHVGTGGERIGRVDLTVVREPATNVPKIPGTTFSGGLKFFTDLCLRDLKIKEKYKGKDISCASIMGSRNEHERDKCPVCYAYGYTPQEKDGKNNAKDSYQGTLQFSDALLFAFPVNTWCGPVWITTKQILHDSFGIGDGIDVTNETFLIPTSSEPPAILLIEGNKLNFGWVLLNKDSSGTGIAKSDINSKIQLLNGKEYLNRLVILPQWIFSHIVNDNMEVRTSVCISPETGAAIEGALFTYEAVPRGTLFYLDIVENDYRGDWNNVKWDLSNVLPENRSDNPKPDNALNMITKYGFGSLETVGFAGMTTRGFGRIKLENVL